MWLDVSEENVTKEGNAILVRINKIIDFYWDFDVYLEDKYL